MDNINLPKEVIQHIKGFIPRDSHMSHPTAALLKNPYAWYQYFETKFSHIFCDNRKPPPLPRFMRGMHAVIYSVHPDDSDVDDDDGDS